jgi:3'-phosphoadenosine 5'-phosphosulfate sulfotransferase (PAPS reductase)/FAD synthetase
VAISPRAIEATNDLVARIKADSRGDTVIVSFSGGKESVGCWLALRQHFPRVIPFYLYLVPGLGFIERGLKMYERYFQTPVLRLPHPSRFRLLNQKVFQPGPRYWDIEELQLPNHTYQDLEDMVREWCGDPTAYVAVGVRARDSLTRWASYKQHGAINRKRRAFYPLIEYTVAELDELFTQHRCPLTVDYRMFGRSFDGIDYRFLEPISRLYPEDYQRILQDFPLADLELFRRRMQDAT